MDDRMISSDEMLCLRPLLGRRGRLHACKMAVPCPMLPAFI